MSISKKDAKHEPEGMRRATLAAAAFCLLFAAEPGRADTAICADHGKIVRTGASGAECADGTVDKRGAAKPRRPDTPRVLRFKPATDRGQVLSPGQQPPTTTLPKSQ